MKRIHGVFLCLALVTLSGCTDKDELIRLQTQNSELKAQLATQANERELDKLLDYKD